MIVYDKKWCTITLNLEKERMIQDWNGFTSFEQFQEAEDFTLMCFKTYKLRAILTNIKKQRIVSEKEKNYAASLMPAMIENGLQDVAFVLPESLTARIPVDEFKALFPAELIAHFEELHEAEQWLDDRLASKAA